jgi:sugar/nucleoside kinase (ribokinase family)
VLAAARAAGCEIWCDLQDYDGAAGFHQPFIEAADVLVVSADRLPDPRGFLHQVVGSGTTLAVCTDGSRGAVAVSATEGSWAVGAVDVPTVIDTNGAGDAFVSGLLAARIGGAALDESLRWASAAGALAVQSIDLVAPEFCRDNVRLLAEQCSARRMG